MLHNNSWKLTCKTYNNEYCCSLEDCFEYVVELDKKHKLNLGKSYYEKVRNKVKSNSEFEDDLFYLRMRI